MTVSSEVNRASYAGNGSTTVFSVPFYFIDATDLVVMTRAADGTETTKTLTTHYTVTGAGNPSGGSVTFLSAPASGVSVVIFRNPPLKQTLDYTDNGRFPAASHMRGLDKLTMMHQRTREIAMRALRPAETDAEIGPLPTATVRAGNILEFDEEGEPQAVTSASEVAANAAAAQAAASQASSVLAGAATFSQINESITAKTSNPNLWYNPNGAFGKGTLQPVPNDGLSVYGPDRWVHQQVTTTPYVSVFRSVDANGNFAIRMLNGYPATGSNSIGTGTKSFTVQAGLNMVAGFPIECVVASDLAKKMIGTIASYSGTTLTLTITSVVGSGTFTDWVVGKDGKTSQAQTLINTTAATSPGSNVLTFASTTNVQIGAAVESRVGYNGIPPGAYVVSKTSTTVTLNANVTSLTDDLHPTPGVTNGQTVTFYGDQGTFVFQDINTFEGVGFKYGTADARDSYLSFDVKSYGVTGVGSVMFLGYSSGSTLGRSFVEDYPVTTTKTRQTVFIPGDTVGASNTWAAGYDANAWGGLWAALGFVWESQGTATSANITPGAWSNTFAVAGSANQTLDLTHTVGAWVEVSDVKLEFEGASRYDPPTQFSYPSPQFRAKAPSLPRVVWESTSNGANQKKWQAYVYGDGSFHIAALDDAETGDLTGLQIAADGTLTLPGYPLKGILVTGETGEVTGVAGAFDALTPYTTAATPSTGSSTFGTIVAKFNRQDKRVEVNITVPVTTVGTGAGPLIIDLPGGFPSTAQGWTLTGYDSGVSGNVIVAWVPPSSTVIQVSKGAGLYPASSGSILNIAGWYYTP